MGMKDFDTVMWALSYQFISESLNRKIYLE